MAADDATASSISTSPGANLRGVPSCANSCSRKSSFSAPPPKLDESRPFDRAEPARETAEIDGDEADGNDPATATVPLPSFAPNAGAWLPAEPPE